MLGDRVEALILIPTVIYTNYLITETLANGDVQTYRFPPTVIYTNYLITETNYYSTRTVTVDGPQ